MTLAILLMLPLTLAGNQTKTDPLAARCNIDLWKDTVRLFVEKDANVWQEVHSARTNKHKLIDLKDNEQTLAQMYSGKGNNIYVTTDTPGEDFTIYEQFCFAADNKIQERHYEIRTAWGWGYEVSTTYDKTGKPSDLGKRFFDTKSEKTIKRPSEVIDEWLKPTIYLSTNKLPFIGLWERRN